MEWPSTEMGKTMGGTHLEGNIKSGVFDMPIIHPSREVLLRRINQSGFQWNSQSR